MCVPGTPCYKANQTIVNVVYPNGCNNCNCRNYPIRSQEIYYSGPNLPYTGINTEDSLTVALQKIDVKLDPTVLLNAIITIINTNPTLKTQLCEALDGCV